MRVPDIQTRLRELAKQHSIPELSELASALSRRSPRSRAQSKSTTVTEAVRQDIRAYAQANPAASQAEIGRRFNVNPGRVSEALRGFRK